MSDHEDGPFLLGLMAGALIVMVFVVLMMVFGAVLWAGGWL